MQLPKLRALLMPGLVLALCGACLFAVLPGCQTDAQTGAITLGGVPLPTTQQVQDGRDEAVATLHATTQAVQDVKDQLQALPANDPTRKALESKLDELQKLEPKLQQAIDLFDAANRSIQSGKVDPQLQGAAGALFGPYGTLAVILLGGGYGLYQTLRAGGYFKAAAQLVQSMEVLGPRTDVEKIKLNQVQDEATRQLVDKIKAKLPAPPVAPGAVTPAA